MYSEIFEGYTSKLRKITKSRFLWFCIPSCSHRVFWQFPAKSCLNIITPLQSHNMIGKAGKFLGEKKRNLFPIKKITSTALR